MWFHVRLLEACNLRCAHCYAKGRDRTVQMDFDRYRDIVDEIVAIMTTRKASSVIYLSGGEPLLHPDLPLMLVYAFDRFDRIHLLTNGFGIEDVVEQFKPYREKLCVQVSLEGDKQTNDAIRGPGAFDKASRALFLLKKYDIVHWISYTVSQVNKHCFESILDLASATQSFFNNVTPYTGNPDLMLDFLQWREFKYRFKRYAKQIGLEASHGSNCCGFVYQCGAFVEGLTVNPDGSVAGCARINEATGSYHDMMNLLRVRPASIHETCMKAKWESVRNFDVLRRLE